MIFIGLVRPDGAKLAFDYPSQYRQFIKSLAGEEVEIEIRKKRSKRTLRQNAAYHAAIAPLAGWREVAGAPLPIRLHTSGLTTKDFATLMDYTMQIAAEHDVLILDPSAWKAAKRKLRKAS